MIKLRCKVPKIEAAEPGSAKWRCRTKVNVAVPFATTDLASAEMIKYASNASLATKINFINEISNLCELVGADVGEVAYGIGWDAPIGSRIPRRP